MRVLKVVAEGITTSFRYPQFMQQIHPTYEMPPPATIYGHIASTLGEWFDPKDVRFAYRFTFSGQGNDIENILVATLASGYLKSTKIPKVLAGSVNPFERAILFQPRLTLYVNRPEWEDAFLSPCYPVLLGRSQDLFIYTSISVVELEQAPFAYFEHTLLPYSTTQYTSHGYAVYMPRYLDYNNNRQPTVARYFIVRNRLDSRDHFLWFGEKPDERYWIDPQSPDHKGAKLGLAFLSFVGKEDETITVS